MSPFTTLSETGYKDGVMHAITIDHPGESGSLKEVPNERPQPGEIVVRISVAGVNPVDWKIRDRAGSPTTPVPFTLGQDFAGVVASAGDGTSDFETGDRVFGVAREHGSYAEFTSVPVDAQDSPIGKIPTRVSDEEAASLPTPGLTALAALEQLHVGRGTTILINGAAGAVGALATQLAHQRGARVIATVKGTPEAVRGLGADDVIDAEASDVIATARERYRDGIDTILDVASSDRDTAMRFAELLRDGGAIVSTNHVLDVDALTQRGFTASNITMSETPQSSRYSLEYLAGLIGDGKLLVRIGHEFPLHDAPRVLDETKAGTMAGKTVLRVTGTAGTD
jgi:NADPH:quinone reductase-like Zn-dependent oxidoreductase